MKKIENSFSISGYVANDAEIRQFETSAVARFAISVSRPEKNATGETTYKSALINVEAWRKLANIDSFDRIKKGELLTLTGYFKPEEWTSADGKKHNRVVLCSNKFHRTPDVVEGCEVPAKASTKKAKAKAEAA